MFRIDIIDGLTHSTLPRNTLIETSLSLFYPNNNNKVPAHVIPLTKNTKMSHLLTPIHRISTRSTSSGGIRWSSYVGDVRCTDNLSKSYSSFLDSRRQSSSATATVTNRSHERLLVLGSGVAGCSVALVAARHGTPCTILHAGSIREDCNSYWAQGGIIYKNYRQIGGGEKAVSYTHLTLPTKA